MLSIAISMSIGFSTLILISVHINGVTISVSVHTHEVTISVSVYTHGDDVRECVHSRSFYSNCNIYTNYTEIIAKRVWYTFSEEYLYSKSLTKLKTVKTNNALKTAIFHLLARAVANTK